MVSFGDSLSDVGTYATAGVKAVSGGVGGKYTINSATAKNWTELIAAQIGVAAPCAAQTGLLSTGPLAGFAEAVTTHPGCFNYAQGGSRVTIPIGPGNALLPPPEGLLGQTTVPVFAQINNHLAAAGGAFSGTELVTVLAGGNDVFMNLATMKATITGGGDATAAAQAAVTAMGQAGAELAADIKTLVLAKGAKYVVVVNLPDVSLTPYAAEADASAPGTKALVNTMVTTFNSQLQAGLGSSANILYVDSYTVSREQFNNPAQFGLTNVTTPACDLTPAKNVLGSSLICTAANLAVADPSTYQYADAVHPTPYGYRLLAQLVSSEMAKKGWQ